MHSVGEARTVPAVVIARLSPGATPSVGPAGLVAGPASAAEIPALCVAGRSSGTLALAREALGLPVARLPVRLVDTNVAVPETKSWLAGTMVPRER